MNLCLMGSTGVVFKKKNHVPQCVIDGRTVSYGATRNDLIADLTAVTFPNNSAALCPASKRGSIKALRSVAGAEIGQLRVAAVQCKTNWNDSLQAALLWNMVYAAYKVPGLNLTVGLNGYNPGSFGDFRYCFVTKPSNQPSSFKTSSLTVIRARVLTGGYYWGNPSKPSVAPAVAEIFQTAKIGDQVLKSLGNHLTTCGGVPQYFGL